MRALLLTALLLAPATGIAQTAVVPPAANLPVFKNQDDLLLLLRAHHEAPTRASLEKVSPDARKIVTQVATQGAGLMQDRAISALATWADDEAWRVLAPLFVRTTTHEMTRHHLLSELSKNFGEKSLGLIEAWLQSSDRDQRLTAAWALAGIETDIARLLAAKAAAAESDAQIKQVLERHLR
jgi:hypothetical protein